MNARVSTQTDALAPAERRALLRIAREAIAAHLARRRAVPGPPALAEPTKRGAFVSFHRKEDGELRGCVGMMRSDEPLVDTVARMAVAAATADGRFAPVREDELSSLAIEISILGPLEPIHAEEVEVGRHGLLIGYAGRRGVLLPQVAIEHGWDREAFLDNTCIKAGLPPGTWRKPGIELLAFTAEVFGEED